MLYFFKTVFVIQFSIQRGGAKHLLALYYHYCPCIFHTKGRCKALPSIVSLPSPVYYPEHAISSHANSSKYLSCILCFVNRSSVTYVCYDVLFVFFIILGAKHLLSWQYNILLSSNVILFCYFLASMLCKIFFFTKGRCKALPSIVILFTTF